MRYRRAVVALLVTFPLACSPYGRSESGVTVSATELASGGAAAPGESAAAYREDIRDFTYAYVDSNGDGGDFDGVLADIAQQYGITNWRESESTYLAIGAGLAKAQITDAELDGYKHDLGHSDPAKMNRIQQGFDSAR